MPRGMFFVLSGLLGVVLSMAAETGPDDVDFVQLNLSGEAEGPRRRPAGRGAAQVPPAQLSHKRESFRSYSHHKTNTHRGRAMQPRPAFRFLVENDYNAKAMTWDDEDYLQLQHYDDRDSDKIRAAHGWFWDLEEENDTMPENPSGRIRSLYDWNKCIDLSVSSTWLGVWKCHNDDNQKWKLLNGKLYTNDNKAVVLTDNYFQAMHQAEPVKFLFQPLATLIVINRKMDGAYEHCLEARGPGETVHFQTCNYSSNNYWHADNMLIKSNAYPNYCLSRDPTDTSQTGPHGPIEQVKMARCNPLSDDQQFLWKDQNLLVSPKDMKCLTYGNPIGWMHDCDGNTIHEFFLSYVEKIDTLRS